ncbi:ABC transporter permease [bacterium]|nr:ABC transporter permease [bacterium]
MLTVSGLALCIVLILFILGVYHGVAIGSVDYVRKTPADIWILQANTNNIMRGTSVLPASFCSEILTDARVASADPVLMLFTNIEIVDERATVLLTGYTAGALGGPPQISAGRELREDGEIVLDEAFARKHDISVGQHIRIRDDVLRVVGLSSGTNAFVTQYAFVTLSYQQSILELPNLASFFIVRLVPGSSTTEVMHAINRKLPERLSMFAHAQFLENNIAEVEAGVVPLFFAIALIGGVVLSIILSLILSVNILERRNDFAVMKIIGAPSGYLRRSVVAQSLLLACLAEGVGLLLLSPILAIIESVTPELAAVVTCHHVALITGAVFVLSTASGLLASMRVRRISPVEVFS